MSSTKQSNEVNPTNVRKYKDGLYVWAFPGMGQFDSYDIKYVRGFFATRKAPFKITEIKDKTYSDDN